MRLAYRGIKDGNEAAPIVSEYFERMRLQKIGYSFKGDDISVFKAACFSVVAAEMDKIESEEHKKAMRRGK